MPTYFKPLRRKIGVLTLLLACVLAAGWVRSYIDDDEFDANGRHYINSQGFFGETTRLGTLNENGDPVNLVPIWLIPYGMVVVPLILLSGWLLHSKPRVKPTLEPTHD